MVRMAVKDDNSLAILDRTGIDLSPNARYSLILAESNCRYLRPVTWPDMVTISTRTAAIGETSWTTEYQIVCLVMLVGCCSSSQHGLPPTGK